MSAPKNHVSVTVTRQKSRLLSLITAVGVLCGIFSAIKCNELEEKVRNLSAELEGLKHEEG